jgi:hypothetical protein
MRLFERGITVRDIAEPFVSFDDGQSALEVRSIDCRVVLNGENKEVAPGATVALYLMARTLRQLFLSFLVFGRNSLKAPLEGQKFRRRGFANTEPTFPFSNHFDVCLSTQSITSTTLTIPPISISSGTEFLYFRFTHSIFSV